MQIPFDEIDSLTASKYRSIYHVNFQNKTDYKKAKYMLSRLMIKWSANDFTQTIYFIGKKL